MMENVVAMEGTAFNSLRSGSLEEYAHALRHLGIDLRQLGRGSFNGLTECLLLDGIRMSRRSGTARYLSQLYFCNSALLVFSRGPEPLLVNGVVIAPGRQLGAAIPTEVLSVFPADTEMLLVEIALDQLPRYLEPAACDRFCARLGQAVYWGCDPVQQSWVTSRLFRLFDRLATAAHPLPPQTGRRLGRLVMRLLEDFVCGQGEHMELVVSAREKTVRRAIQHLLQEPDSSLEELAAASFASKRSLQYLFRELLGQKVNSVAKVLGLNQLRRELVRPDAATGFGELALRHGFSNPSRAGREYRALFGESMADTRERSRSEPGDKQPAVTGPDETTPGVYGP